MRGLRASVASFLLVGLMGVGVACKREAPDTRAADEAAIRSGSGEMSNAAGAKDLEKVLTAYADDASMFAPNAPIATGKEAIRQAWSQFMGSPGYALSWQATKVEVARSGDLGYEVGTYELTLNDAKGKPGTTPGKYVVVWKKQADGSWKIVADIFNADQ